MWAVPRGSTGRATRQSGTTTSATASKGYVLDDKGVFRGPVDIQGHDGVVFTLDDAPGSAGGNARLRLRHSQSAWPRLVTLFLLVYSGSVVSEPPVQAYGGTLFEPGDPKSSDPVLRAIAAFENPEKAPYDIIVYDILDCLTRATMSVR